MALDETPLAEHTPTTSRLHRVVQPQVVVFLEVDAVVLVAMDAGAVVGHVEVVGIHCADTNVALGRDVDRCRCGSRPPICGTTCT